MNEIFVSWSKSKGKELAKHTKYLLETLLPDIKVFMSEEDIYAGEHVQEKIIQHIEQCNTLILCFTSDNKKSPWLLYEAGYASGLHKCVIPFLFEKDSLWHSWIDNPMNIAREIDFSKDTFTTDLLEAFSIKKTTYTEACIDAYKKSIIETNEKYRQVDIQCEDFVEKLDRRATKLRYNAYCEGAKKYVNNPGAVIALYRECLAYNKSLEYKTVEGYYDGEYKQGELLDLTVFPDEVRNEVDDNRGKPVSMENDYSIEEILDMPIEGEVQMNLTNTDCVEQDELCKNESHGGKIPCELFCVTGNNSDLVDIDDLY